MKALPPMVLLALLACVAVWAQPRMVLENVEKDKKVIIEEGDMVRVQFLADSVLHRVYRPWGYRRKERRISFVQGSVAEYTPDGFRVIARRRGLRRLFSRRVDTLTVSLDQVMAIHKTSSFKLLGTSVLTQAAVRGTALVVLTATGNFWVFMGLNVTGFVLSPFTRKYVRNATIPLRKIPETRAKWKLYREDAPQSSLPGSDLPGSDLPGSDLPGNQTPQHTAEDRPRAEANGG